MSYGLIVVGVIVVLAVVLFLTEWWPPALVSMMVMVALVASGVISPAEGFEGFANTATVMVAAMFVISTALEKTGAVDRVGEALGELMDRRRLLAWLLLLGGVGVTSAFINNTTVVAVLIPVLLRFGNEQGISPSKLLLPVSFASMFGGVCTLIGTSTNLLVSSIVAKSGQPSIGLFEMAPVGLVFFAVGLLYLTAVRAWIPERRRPEGLASSYSMGAFLTDARLAPDAPSIGTRVREAGFGGLDLEIIAVLRDGEPVPGPLADVELQAGDMLRVRGDRELVRALRSSTGLLLGQPEVDQKDLEAGPELLLEMVVTPDGEADHRRLGEVRFRERFNAAPLAVRDRGEVVHGQLDRLRLRGGDVVLAVAPKSSVESIRSDGSFLLLSRTAMEPRRRSKTALVLGITAGVVLLAAFGLLPIAVSAVLGCIVLVMCGCLSLEEAVRGIRWRVVLLLAGLIALGNALGATGADELLGSGLARVHEAWGPHAVVAVLYVVTVVATSVMSNNATAALISPVALAAAAGIGIEARPLVMAVAFGASTCFLTPVGYQTNTMVYGAGHYRFADFVRIGAPLTLLLTLLAVLLIPVAWPF